MNDKSNLQVPYIAFEGELARSERHIKRLWISLIIMITAYLVTIIGFLWYLSLYDYSSYDYEQDGSGVNIIGDKNGVDYNGTESFGEAQNSKA